MEDNKKGVFKCVSNRRKTRENAGLLLNAVEQLNNSFASVFSAKTAFWESQTLETASLKQSILLKILRSLLWTFQQCYPNCVDITFAFCFLTLQGKTVLRLSKAICIQRHQGLFHAQVSTHRLAKRLEILAEALLNHAENALCFVALFVLYQTGISASSPKK